MSKLSDALNTSINANKQRELFDDSKDIKKDRGVCVVRKQVKIIRIKTTLQDLIGRF